MNSWLSRGVPAAASGQEKGSSVKHFSQSHRSIFHKTVLPANPPPPPSGSMPGTLPTRMGHLQASEGAGVGAAGGWKGLSLPFLSSENLKGMKSMPIMKGRRASGTTTPLGVW